MNRRFWGKVLDSLCGGAKQPTNIVEWTNNVSHDHERLRGDHTRYQTNLERLIDTGDL